MSVEKLWDELWIGVKCQSNTEIAGSRLGGEVVKAVFLMELAGLKGRERLEGYDVDAVITYPGK